MNGKARPSHLTIIGRNSEANLIDEETNDRGLRFGDSDSRVVRLLASELRVG